MKYFEKEKDCNLKGYSCPLCRKTDVLIHVVIPNIIICSEDNCSYHENFSDFLTHDLLSDIRWEIANK
jgi:hypothetical protein